MNDNIYLYIPTLFSFRECIAPSQMGQQRAVIEIIGINETFQEVIGQKGILPFSPAESRLCFECRQQAAFYRFCPFHHIISYYKMPNI